MATDMEVECYGNAWMEGSLAYLDGPGRCDVPLIQAYMCLPSVQIQTRPHAQQPCDASGQSQTSPRASRDRRRMRDEVGGATVHVFVQVSFSKTDHRRTPQAPVPTRDISTTITRRSTVIGSEPATRANVGIGGRRAFISISAI